MAIACMLAVAMVPGWACAGRLVAAPDAGSPDLAELANKNPTLEVPRVYSPDGDVSDAIALPGTADDNEDNLDPDSFGPDPDAADADIPDLPDSGAVAVNPDDPDVFAPDANTALSSNQNSPAPDIGTAEDYSNQPTQARLLVVVQPIPFYSTSAAPTYVRPQTPPPANYTPPVSGPAFAVGVGSPPAWSVRSYPAWAARPMTPLMRPMGMRSFPTR